MSKKLIIILSAAALVMMMFMGGIFFMMWSKISQMEGQMPATQGPEIEEAAVAETTVKPIFPLKSFIVNLAGDSFLSFWSRPVLS